jgi:hypothetical protein
VGQTGWYQNRIIRLNFQYLFAQTYSGATTDHVLLVLYTVCMVWHAAPGLNPEYSHGKIRRLLRGPQDPPGGRLAGRHVFGRNIPGFFYRHLILL